MSDSSNNNRPALDVRQLVKTFRQGRREVQVLRGVDLTVPVGSFTAVMGASGSGKSTLLHLLAGLTSATSGIIHVGEHAISTLSDAALTRFRRRHVGLVFQDYNLIPTLSAADNILLPRLIEGGRCKLDMPLMERLQLVERLQHRPEALSGGERQRVAIARALTMDPEVLLADEPTGNLDSITAREVCGVLKDLNRRENRTILLVTHDPLVATFADRVLLLRDGRMVDEFEVRGEEDATRISLHYFQHMASSTAHGESRTC